MGRQPFRLPPRLPVTAVQTYQVSSPLSSHWRPATCEEVDCPQWRSGWRIRTDDLTPQQLQAARDPKRKFTALDVSATEHWLVFEPGQPCFLVWPGTGPLLDRHHRVQVRPELYVIRDGDWRGNPTGRRHVLGAQAWLDDFGEHQETLADRLKEG